MSRAQLTSTVEQNTGGAVSPYVAGKNKIINGDFGIWQRGTSFTGVSNTDVFTADRWVVRGDGSGFTKTITQQAFTVGTAPVAGYESAYYLQFAQTVAGSGATYSVIQQRIEDVRTFAGQNVTISFWAKADSSRTVSVSFDRNYGSGGSLTEYAQSSTSSFTLTTSWARYSQTVSIASLAGKTVGAGSYLAWTLNNNTLNATNTISIWGVQLEAGSVATPFTTATGTLSGELAACQRYFQIYQGAILSVTSISTSNIAVVPPSFVPFRTTPAFNHNLTDANYVATAPTGSQWTLGNGTIAFSTKSGTATINYAGAANNQSFGLLKISGATFTPQPDNLFLGSNAYIQASAEL